MHDDGEKPYLCVHEGCERSRPGHGFPGSWTLKDHMRRVHDDPDWPAQGISPAPSVTITRRTWARARKRKNEIQEREPKSRSSSTKAAAEPPRLARHKRNEEEDAGLEQQDSVEHLVRGAGGPLVLHPRLDS